MNIRITGCLVGMVLALMTGCVSPLLSSDLETRKQAMEKISDQQELFFIAMNVGVGLKDKWPEMYQETHLRHGEYPDDVRVMAVKKLTNPRYLLLCASWQDNDTYVDPASKNGRFEYKGETFYLNGNYVANMSEKVSPGDVVRAAAIERMSDPAIFTSLPKAVQIKDKEEYGAVSALFPKNSEVFFSNYGRSVRPGNPMNNAIAKASERQNAKNTVRFLIEGASWMPVVAPLAYDGCIGKLAGVDDADAKKLYRELFLKNEYGCAATRFYSGSTSDGYEDVVNRAKEWVWIVYRNIEGPDLEVVTSALKNADQKHSEEILGRVKDPEIFVRIYGDESIVKSVPKNKTVTMSGAYGSETVDLVYSEAVEKLKRVNDQKALIALANGAKLFSIRAAALDKIDDENVLAKIAAGEINNCPYDTSLKGHSWGDNGISWISKTQDASKANLQKHAIERMKNTQLLKGVRKTVANQDVKKTATKRLAALGASDVDEICAYDHFDADLFAMLDEMDDQTGLKKISTGAKLKGVRLMAAQKVSKDVFGAVAKKESVPTTKCEQGKINLGGYYLGLNIEDAFAMLASSYPSLDVKLYLDDKVICIADGNDNDIAWANAKTRVIHWLTLPPLVVKNITGFSSGSFDDLERAVEKKFAISFGTDIVKKGEVTQKIGNLDTTEGETLRYFKSDLGKGEDFSRSVRKAVNQHTMDTNPLNGGIGAAFANAFENAMQADENNKNAKSPRFAARGSLQLQATSQATKGEWGATGTLGASAGGVLKTIAEGVDHMNTIKGDLDELKRAGDKLKSVGAELNNAMDQLNNLSL